METQHKNIIMGGASLCFAALLLLLVSAVQVSAASVNGPDLNASLLYYEPVPAIPGAVLDVFVQIENEGATAREASVEFIDNEPFTLETESDRVKRTGSIPAQESFLVK